ncbi:MAG: hypothetical protein RLZZ455_1047 [Candidatus Parcubacteria bacterium]|jgi:hypothetical protein
MKFSQTPIVLFSEGKWESPLEQISITLQFYMYNRNTNFILDRLRYRLDRPVV